MGGYVTQSRYVKQGRLPFSYNANGINTVRSYLDSTAGGTTYPSLPQTTTSYRSSGTEIPADDPLQASSHGDFVKRLITEDHETRGGYDTGHTFNTIRSEFRLSHPNFRVSGLVNPTLSSGFVQAPLMALTSDSSFRSFPVIPNLTSNEINYYGGQFIRNTAPVNSVAGLSVALAEFYREGLPRLVGASALKDKLHSKPSGLGEEYLNWEFGYKPLANDLATTLSAVIGSHQTALQYIRDSGRTVRRRRTLGTIKSATQSFTGGEINFLGAPASLQSRCFSNPFGAITVDTLTEQTYSFSAAYTYYVPGSANFLDRMGYYASLAEKVTGLGVTPDTIWNLAPWSWLSDWIWNLGGVISNLSLFSTDGLVMRYAYLMRETKVTKVLTHPGSAVASGGHTGPVSATFVSIRKERVKATPYGFSLNPTTFTSRQWAILGALGLTKAPTSLR